MSSHNLPAAFVACLCLSSVSSFGAEAAPDLVSPKIREKVVTEATRVAQSLNSAAPIASPLPDPFIAKQAEQPATEPQASVETSAFPPADSIELLERLAQQIPATGTVTLGGEPMLLLGQKRLKVGDPYTISFEGQTYEVSIAAITATSFTVKRGALLFSRPTRLSVPNTSTPSSRP